MELIADILTAIKRRGQVKACTIIMGDNPQTRYLLAWSNRRRTLSRKRRRKAQRMARKRHYGRATPRAVLDTLYTPAAWAERIGRVRLFQAARELVDREDVVSVSPWFNVPWKPEYEDLRQKITEGLTVDRRTLPPLMTVLETLWPDAGMYAARERVPKPCHCGPGLLQLVRTETLADGGGPVAIHCPNCGAIGLNTTYGRERAIFLWNDKGDNREEYEE